LDCGEKPEIPNIVDVAIFGGPTREYQVRVDPNKLISYGLNIGQVEEQIAANNINAGCSEQHRSRRQHEKSVAQREIDVSVNHLMAL
jgi:Cu/Ag efflux pump CusA